MGMGMSMSIGILTAVNKCSMATAGWVGGARTVNYVFKWVARCSRLGAQTIIL